MIKHLEALLFVPIGPGSARWLAMCYAYCQARGYKPLAVVSTWDAAMHYVVNGFNGVIVACPGHIPPDRRPRIEVVSDEPVMPETPPVPGQRRVRRRE